MPIESHQVHRALLNFADHHDWCKVENFNKFNAGLFFVLRIASFRSAIATEARTHNAQSASFIDIRQKSVKETDPTVISASFFCYHLSIDSIPIRSCRREIIGPKRIRRVEHELPRLQWEELLSANLWSYSSVLRHYTDCSLIG